MHEYNIGIDPGKSGSIVVLNSDFCYVAHLLMPVLTIGKKTRVNGAAIAAFLSKYKNGYCRIEKVGAMPKQGVSSMFSFGHSAGVVEGVVAGAGIPFGLVTPQAWKKRNNLTGKDKDAARSRAIQLYPAIRELDAKIKGQAIADAIFLARY